MTLELRDAKAGDYKHSLRTFLKSFLYYSGGLKYTQELAFSGVTVLDISFYQISANFQTMLDLGVKGVIIRSGQNLWHDTCAETFMTDAESVEMPIGAYWFYDSRVHPREQAQKWKDVLGSHETKLRCWADYEEKYGGAYGGWRNFYNFLEYCKALMPDRKFGIYTGYYYWVEHSPNPITEAGSLNYFAQYPLWLAWYTNDPSVVKIPKPWNKITFWQYTSKGDGQKYGVGSLGLDMNNFDGSLEQYNAFFGLTGSTPPPTGETGMYEVVSTQYNMSLRNDNSIYGAKIDIVPTNTLMIADQISPPSSGGISGDSWAHIPSLVINGVQRSGWVAVVHLGTIYCDVKQIQEPISLPDVLYIATREDMSDKQKYTKVI